MTWFIRGEFLENCNCDVLCPCITSALKAPADHERCLVPIVCHIDEGRFEDVDLGNLNFVMVLDTPAVMADGNWRAALYLDENADDQQRQALGGILSGQHGGVPEMLGGLIGTMLGVKYVPIHFESEGIRRRASIEGIMDVEVEGVRVSEHDAVMEISNVFHPMGTSLPVAKSTRGHYSDADYGLSFDNAGKNGHYRDFEWQGA